MAITTNNFDAYFQSIQNKQKVGDLEDARGKVVSIAEHKSNKTGRTSLKMTIDVNGAEVYAYLGYNSDKSAEISKARLTKLSIAAIGIEETKKIYEAAANDEDVETDAEFIVEFAGKLNKKLKKSPVDIIVTRKKEGDFWDTTWRLPDMSDEEDAPKAEATDDFLQDIQNDK